MDCNTFSVNDTLQHFDNIIKNLERRYWRRQVRLTGLPKLRKSAAAVEQPKQCVPKFGDKVAQKDEQVAVPLKEDISLTSSEQWELFEQLEEIKERIGDKWRTRSQLRLLGKIRQLLFKDRKSLSFLIHKGGIVPLLIKCLNLRRHSVLQIGAALTLCNIAELQNFDYTRALLYHGAIPVLINLISAEELTLSDMSLCTLTTIAYEPVLRDYLLSNGLMRSIMIQIRNPDRISLSLVLLISHLCSWSKQPPPLAQVSQLLVALHMIIERSRPCYITLAVTSINNLARNFQYKAHIFQVIGLMPRIIRMLGSRKMKIQRAALVTISNIMFDKNEMVETSLFYDVLVYIPRLLQHQNEDVSHLAMNFLTKFTISSEIHVQPLLNVNVFPPMIELLAKAPDGTQRLALKATSRIIENGTNAQVLTLMRSGVVPPLCNLLTDVDVDIVHLALQCLHTMFYKVELGWLELVNLIGACNGVHAIEALQYHKTFKIYLLALDIIGLYLSLDEKYLQFVKNAGHNETLAKNDDKIHEGNKIEIVDKEIEHKEIEQVDIKKEDNEHALRIEDVGAYYLKMSAGGDNLGTQ